MFVGLDIRPSYDLVGLIIASFSPFQGSCNVAAFSPVNLVMESSESLKNLSTLEDDIL